MTRRRKPSYFVPALEKGLDILEALSLASVPQPLADLARLCNRSRGEIFRMVDALEKRKYIVRDPVSGGYELTLKLYQLAHRHSPMDHLLKAAYFPMRELAERLRESCHLCVLGDDQLLVIAEAESPDPVRLSVAVGYRTPPLTTVSGRLLLAMLEDSSRSRILEKDASFRSMTSTQRSRLQVELERIRKNRTHMAPSMYRTGVDVSCLVGSPEIGISAALGVPIIAGGMNHGNEKSLIPLIREHALRITRAAGLYSGKGKSPASGPKP